MRTVWKYELQVINEQTISMPVGYRVLCVQLQNGKPCLWVEVDTDAPRCSKTIYIRGTGNPLAEYLLYIGTFQTDGGAFVWHVYE